MASEILSLGLTGPNSHRVEIEAGQGRFTLGPAGIPGPRADAVVPADAAIDWTTFDALTVPAGYPWPRLFDYRGADTGFVGWSRTRPIEGFTWRPTAAATLDLTGAQIGNIEIVLGDTPLELILGGQRDLSLRGNLSLLRVGTGEARLPTLAFAPDPPSPGAPARLPPLPAFAHAETVSIYADVLAPGFDCSSLLQFPALRSLSLYGHMCQLDRLAELDKLETLQLRFCRDLSGLPPLDAWPRLESLIAWNVEAQAAARVRAEAVRSKKAGRVWRRVSVTKPRPVSWFAKEAGLPFAGWPRKSEQAAAKAYRAAAAAMLDAADQDAQASAVRGFVAAINALTVIETSEREDAAAAVHRLALLAPGLDPALALRWFNAARDF